MNFFEKVKEIIVETMSCNEDDVTLEASLSDDLELDSLDAVQLNMAIEEETGIAIPDEELENLKTIKDIVEYLENHAE